MSTPNTVILSAPAAWCAREGMEALLDRFGCEQVIDEWNPRCAHVPGALHITSTPPAALLKHLQFNKPWLVRFMHHRGWDEQRQRIADMRQQAGRALIRALAGLAFFIMVLGIVGPWIDGAADDKPRTARAGDSERVERVERTVQHDAVAWTDPRGQLQQRNVITVVHRRQP